MADYFKTLKDQITKQLLNTFNTILEKQEYLPTGNKAHIKVIPKPGRHPQNPASYSSISLINIDTKLLSKILADRLAKLMPSLIHNVQSGFTKGRSAVLNIRRTLAVLEHSKNHPETDISILALVEKKAVDNVMSSSSGRALLNLLKN